MVSPPTENPKLVAVITSRATESYNTDTRGGAAIDFFTSPNTPGAANVPVLAMSIGQDKALNILGAIDHDGSTVGFYGKTPVAQAAAITSPSADVNSLKTAVDLIRTALSNVGITA